MHIPSYFSGDIIRPGDNNYMQASTVLMRKGAPALILRPKSAADVVAAIRYGIEDNLGISVRSGGHSIAGLSTNDGGLVIDLHYLNQVELLDPQKHNVRIGTGATWGDVAQFLTPHGLAISSGDTKTVGVGGLISGGGIGWMVRKYGLTIDNTVAAQIVTADGAVLQASSTENPDLFWAMRGGGGNMGVVTSVDIIAAPIDEVFWGTINYDISDMPRVLKGWRDATRQAPVELTTMAMVLPAQFGPMPTVMVMVCYAGNDESAAARAIEPLRHLATPTHEDISKQPYATTLGDAHLLPNTKVINNNVFVQDFSDELIDTLCQQKDQILQIRSVGGAMNRVPADATAFAHRDSEILIVCPVFVASNATAQEIEVALRPWHKIVTFGKGAYVNFFSEITPLQVEAAYPPATYRKLARLKTKYDPQNVFNQNLNIKPAKE
jgi:FAD/FMN-containing dehydrogenase